MTELLPDFFAAWRAVRTVPRINHVAHLGGISPREWQTKPCERVAKAAGEESLPVEGAAWLLGREADRPVNVFEALTGLFPLLNGQHINCLPISGITSTVR